MKKIVIDRQEVLKAYEIAGNKKKVAELLGVSKKVINKMFVLYNIEYDLHPNRIRFSRELLEEMYKTKTKREIADELGVGITTICKHFKTYKIKIDKSAGKDKVLTQEMRDVIIGSILGDGYICNRSLEISHSFKQLDYLKYKLNLLTDICKGTLDPRLLNGDVISYKLRTYCRDEIAEYYNLFYYEKIKQIPKDIAEYLTPLAVAIWYMDDGGIRGKHTGRIATCCFTKEEVELLSSSLNAKYSLTTRVASEGKYYTIYLPAKNECFDKFCEIIREYVPECMLYKLSKV